jgi:hypothetical protein
MVCLDPLSPERKVRVEHFVLGNSVLIMKRAEDLAARLDPLLSPTWSFFLITEFFCFGA